MILSDLSCLLKTFLSFLLTKFCGKNKNVFFPGLENDCHFALCFLTPLIRNISKNGSNVQLTHRNPGDLGRKQISQISEVFGFTRFSILINVTCFLCSCILFIGACISHVCDVYILSHLIK